MSTGKGWWRRNWWALLAVLPVLVAFVVVGPGEPYQTWRNAEPREAVGPDPDGWVSYAGLRLRLTELAPPELREPVTAEPFALPAGLAAWQATLTIAGHPDPDTFIGCQFELEDGAGRRFGAAPEVLEDAAGPDGFRFDFASCNPPTVTDEEEPPPDTFETVVLFAVPSSARPAAVRVINFEELPAYARFDVGAWSATG